MMQSVLLTAMRGPDGIHKNHVSKLLIRWMRRCVLISAFDGEVLKRPYDIKERKGGSFTGPSLEPSLKAIAEEDDPGWTMAMHGILNNYMLTLDEVPHHFQLHFLHAAEILAHYHPDHIVREWWWSAYARLCNDMHLNPETREQLENRLCDNEARWRATEEVKAD